MEILEEFRPIKTFHDTDTFKRFEKIMKTGLPAVAGEPEINYSTSSFVTNIFLDKHKQKLVKILRKLQRLASNEDRMHSDWRILSAKKRKVMKWIAELRQSETNENMEKLEFRVSTELNRILDELNMMTEDKCKVCWLVILCVLFWNLNASFPGDRSGQTNGLGLENYLHGNRQGHPGN